jgi:hypothetical protein
MMLKQLLKNELQNESKVVIQLMALVVCIVELKQNIEQRLVILSVF